MLSCRWIVGVFDEAREQRYLAHLFLSLLIDPIGESIERPYSFGFNCNLLHPGAPPRPRDFLHRTIVFSGKHVRGLVKELTKKFVLHRDGPEIAARLGQVAFTRP
jgi:hypothetical protein